MSSHGPYRCNSFTKIQLQELSPPFCNFARVTWKWVRSALPKGPWFISSYLGVKRVYGLIETPAGVVGLPEFVRGIDRRPPLPGVALSGLIFGAEDFATAMGITRSPTLIEMLYARQLVVAVSKTKQINCIDLVRSPTCLTDDIGVY